MHRAAFFYFIEFIVCLSPVAHSLVAVPIPEAIRSRLEVAPAELLARPGPMSVQSQPV